MKQTIAITRFPFESQLGGEELHTLSLAKHWQAQGHKVKLFSDCPVLIKLFDENNLAYEICHLAKPPVTKLGPLRFLFFYPLYLFRARKLAKALKAYGTTAVYMLSFSEKLILPWFLARRIKLIFCEHARIGNWFRLNPWRAVYLLFARRAKVVTVSRQSAKALGYKQAIIIPNGVNIADFATRIPPVKSDTLTITTIGRLTEDKGMLEFINSLALFAKSRSQDLQWQAKIIGTGPLMNELKGLAKKLNLADKIDFLGLIDRQKIIQTLQQTDIFCLLSTKPDPFGLVVAEAMAAGATPVASEVCGIIDYSEKIIKTPVNDWPAASEILLKLATKRPTRATMQAEAKKTFSEEAMFKAFDQLWQ